MSQMSTAQPAETAPWMAVALSLCSTGLGHIYCGQLKLGLALFAGSFLFAPVIVGAAMIEASTRVLIGMIVGVLAIATIYLVAAADAYRLARRLTRGGVQRRLRSQGPAPMTALYVLLVIAGIGLPLVGATYVRGFIHAYYIHGQSMAPSVLAGDYVLVNNTAYRKNPPRRGDVAVFVSPEKRDRTLVKRVIALPGDTVAVVAGKAFVNGEPLSRPRANGVGSYEEIDGRRYRIGSTGTQPDFPETRVPDGECFMLGDNRGQARDGRHFGFVPLTDVLGQLQYIYLPAADWSRFGAYHDQASPR